MTTDPAAPAPAPADAAPAPAAPSPAPAAAFDWAGTLGKDYDTLKPVIEGDKLTDPKALLTAYTGLKQSSSGALTVPGADAKPEEWSAFYAKIGKPENADGYQFTKPEGMEGYSDQMAGWFRGASHQANLTSQQAAVMHDAYVEMFKTQAQTNATEAANQEKALSDDIAKNWGSTKDKNLALAKRAARDFGFDAKMLDSLETKIGSFKMLDAFAKIGEAMGEDSIHKGLGPSSGPNPWTKDGLNLTKQAKIMREDPALAARLMAQAGVKPPSV